ncbi:MAG: hypothetical protein HGA96_08360 [Desulfobulbaceae bacterium]|nr:hypothetical protein [Desulfobulbaceae bacterium]
MASQNNNDDTGYSPAVDDELLYEQALRRLRLEIDKGRTYAQAFKVISSMESGLKKELGEDFMRLIIAERHFGEGYGIDDLALLLDVNYEKIEAIRDYMLRDIGNSLNRERRRLVSLTTH